MAPKPENPEVHRDFVADELEAYRKYSPTQMIQCWECDNWHPKQYRCPVCGNDHTAD